MKYRTKSVSGRNLKTMWIIIVYAGIFQTFLGLCHACYVFPVGKKDPCEGMTCYLGAICVPSKNGLEHRCVCPERCENYGDNVGGTPVCGNNGKDYNSSCELRKASCTEMKEIKLKYYGKCEPCAGFVCKPPNVCQLGEGRKPVCRCAQTCPDTLQLVCASDGATYSNICRLQMEACRTMRDIRLHHPGQCQGNNPCNVKTCTFGQECSIDKNGHAKCRCPPPCEPVVQQVCGSDGYTYDNECELVRDACQHENNVKRVHHGPCGNEEISCRGHSCRNDAICQMRGGHPICECPVCSEEIKPVCGTDGRTYHNECQLRLTNCEFRTEIQSWHEGKCRGCGDQDQHCDFYSVCDKSSESPTCVCPKACNENQEARLCGSDGKTYRNECELMLESCQLQKTIIVASIGKCELCKGTTCKFGARCENGTCVCPLTCPRTLEPVCASNRNTYENECKMKRASCVGNEDLYVVDNRPCEHELDPIYSGGGSGDYDMPICDETVCKHGGECQLNEQGTYACICNFNCQAIRSSVCGSDGRTYGNLCQMQHESCRQQREVTQVSMDNCFDINEEACDGSKPLVDGRGEDYTCSSAHMCPANSYCHQQFNKCCHEGVCSCNERGSMSITCNPKTRECQCKPGVGGKQCNHCLPGYWGLARERDNVGCVPCNCHPLGRQRVDCDQTTGKCVCRPKIRGAKCDLCPDSRPIVSRYGCPGDDVLPIPRTCVEVQCGFGGTCVEYDNRAYCDCESLPCFRLDWPRSVTVCGSDLNTYPSECELKRAACNQQTNITIVYQGSCDDRSRTTPLTMMNGHPRRTPNYRATTPTPFHERPRSSYKTTRHAEHAPPEASSEVTRTLTHATDRPRIHTHPLVEGKILDICLDDTYCSVQNSHCHLGICTCWKGYIPTLDNTHCSEVRQVKAMPPHHEQSVCSINPCRNKGVCIADHLLGYRCLCPLGKTGPNCKKDAVIHTPSFTGLSYMSVMEIRKANDDLTIDLIFTSLNSDGLLLFSSQFLNGTGDFISLTLIDAFVEFRFDLGSGIAIIRSNEKIVLNQECHVTASRFDRKGMLILDDAPGVSQMSPASLVSLDLKGPLYIGYLPEHAELGLERAGVRVGFAGCMTSLQASTSHQAKLYDLTYPQVHPHIYKARDIGECGHNPCSSLPCKHRGTCLMSDSEIFTCHCQDGYIGENCEIIMNPCVSAVCQHGATCRPTVGGAGYECVCPDNREGEFCEYEKLHEIFVPEFNGSSYIQLPLGDVSSTALSLKVWFMTRKTSGVLLYASQFPRGLGDFVSVNIIEQNVEFRFNMGSGTVVIRSDEKISLNEWHEVYVQKVDRAGTLVIDSSEERLTKRESQGGLTELNLQEGNLFLGGYRNNSIPVDSNIFHNFTGVIQRIYINGRLIDNIMEAARDAVNINEYIGNPCNVNPCLNGGICVPKLSEADCKCPIKYLGQRCEKRSDAINKDLPVRFDGNIFLRYPNEISHEVPGQRTNKYTLKFRAARDGLLLYQQGALPTLGDYLAIAVVEGKIELSYNLGRQTEADLHIIRSTVRVDDLQWHNLVADRDERQATLQVDEERPVKGVSAEGASQLDTDGNLWIGGKHSLPSGLPAQYSEGFIGCVEEIYINDRKLQMVDHRSDQRSPIIRFCV